MLYVEKICRLDESYLASLVIYGLSSCFVCFCRARAIIQAALTYIVFIGI